MKELTVSRPFPKLKDQLESDTDLAGDILLALLTAGYTTFSSKVGGGRSGNLP